MSIIKPRQYKKEMKEVNVLVSDDIYGCDYCKKEIDLNNKDVEYLETTVHYNKQEPDRLHYCSWKCCLGHVKTLKTDYFINLPYLSKDIQGDCSYEAFIKEIK